MMDENGNHQYGIDGITTFAFMCGEEPDEGSVWFEFKKDFGLARIWITRGNFDDLDSINLGIGDKGLENLKALSVAINKTLNEIPKTKERLGFT